MHEYFFVWERKTRTFLMRFWVRPAGVSDDAAPANIFELDGSIDDAASEALVEPLRAIYPEPEFLVHSMMASSWQSVEQAVPGLLNE